MQAAKAVKVLLRRYFYRTGEKKLQKSNRFSLDLIKVEIDYVGVCSVLRRDSISLFAKSLTEKKKKKHFGFQKKKHFGKMD